MHKGETRYESESKAHSFAILLKRGEQIGAGGAILHRYLLGTVYINETGCRRHGFGKRGWSIEDECDDAGCKREKRDTTYDLEHAPHEHALFFLGAREF